MRRVPGEKVVFAKDHWLLLANAVEKPADYSSRKLTKLRSSVDMALSAISEALLGQNFQSWMILRQQLNASAEAGRLTEEFDIKLANATLELLRHRDLIYRKDYSDRTDDVQSFCEDFLKAVVNLTGYPPEAST